MNRDLVVATVASLAHEEWRKPRLISGTHGSLDAKYEPRIKPTGLTQGGEVDIANTTYSALPPKWQTENRKGAESAVDAVQDQLDHGANLSEIDVEAASDMVHDAWIKRNDWARKDSPQLCVPYAELPEDEKEKDRFFVRAAIGVMRDQA
jgi:hypothetical protein